MTALYDIKIQEKRDKITDEAYACVTVTYLGNKAPDEFSDLAKLRKFSVNGATVSLALADATEAIEQHFAGEKGKVA